MNTPNPALVAQSAVPRLPRWALLAFCAAWILPGIFGRDPWRNADVTAFGVMSAMAEGRSSWWQATLGGVALDASAPPHWLGALFIMALSPAVDPAIAARLPYALLLTLTLVGTWYSCFHLARTEAAQPVAFAFGGEALPVDYARALADAALLALIATLGLLQLGHETTPELVQLFASTLFLWSVSAAPYRVARARLGILCALPLLAASGAPTMALLLGLAGGLVCAFSHYGQARRFAWWVAASSLLALWAAWAAGAWAWRVDLAQAGAEWTLIARQWAWFLWPAGPLAVWTLWQWRRHWRKRHVSLPGSAALLAVGASVAMGGHDRALLLALPALAVLAAFALPTMRRSLKSAIDWFSVFFFSAALLFVWAMYIAMQSGRPTQWAANIARLAPGFTPTFSAWALGLALCGTLGWAWLVRWRTRRQQHALWKSLVLPAGGVAACWLLLMTLWLPLLDHGRSARPVIERAARHMGAADCINAPGLAPAMVASIEVFARRRVDASAQAAESSACDVRVHVGRVSQSPVFAQWSLVGSERRTNDRSELFSVYRRVPPVAGSPAKP